MNTPFKGFDTKEITLYAGENVKPGMVVKLGDNCTAMAANNGDKFCGVCTAVRGDYASVVMKGYAKVTYTGPGPVAGYAFLSAAGDGTVKIVDDGREYLVISVNTIDKSLEILIN